MIAHAETLAALTGTYRFNRSSYTTFQKVLNLGFVLSIRDVEGALEVRTPVGTWRMAELEPLRFRAEAGRAELAFRTDEDGRATHAFMSVAPMFALARVPWHGIPALHFVILGGGLLFFIGVLFAPGVRSLFGWKMEEEEPRARTVARRSLLAAAGANLVFVILVVILLALDFWRFFTTPMTGFAIALPRPVLGALAAGAAAVSVGILWWKRASERRVRILLSVGVGVTLLYVWSLHYWKLLGWYL